MAFNVRNMKFNLRSLRTDILSLGIASFAFPLLASAQEKPNVVFIAVDDLNDWVGAFGGNPQVKTPNLDKFCRENGMVFTNAHCTGSVSCPSRSSLLSGFRPERTGCYNNNHNMLKSELIQQHATLPEYFSKNGYITISKGKIFHKHKTAEGLDEGQWAFDIWEKESGNDGIIKEQLCSRADGMINGQKAGDQTYVGSGGSDFAWAPTKGGIETTLDYKTAAWFAGKLKEDFDKPFFMAVGFSKPHLPWYVPQEFFDMYPLESVKIPDYRMDDLDDILTPSGKKKFEPTDDFLWLKQSDSLYRAAIRAYMASISYVDHCIGKLLEAVKRSKYADNTIIVIWGDHGWHLGEKLRFRKVTLWSESTRMPLMISTPSMKSGSQCPKVVNLIDIYPTLVDLCGLPKRAGLDGRSFVPLLKNPAAPWPYASVTTKDPGSYTVNSEAWRFIHYADGTEELYNLKDDPMEWKNLIKSSDKVSLEAKAELIKFAPQSFHKGLPLNEKGKNKEDFSDSETHNSKIKNAGDAIKKLRSLENLK